jgi:hypothetical protein
MSIFNDKIIKSVAEAAAKIMAQESSHGSEPKTEKEKSLAALAHPKDKITHKDVLVGRGVLKKEEVDMGQAGARKTQPSSKEAQEKVFAKHKERMEKLNKEEVEQIDEKEGYSAKEARAGQDIGKPGKMFSKIAASAAKRYGSAESGRRVAGAVLAKLRKEESDLTEEPDNEQWTKELKDQEATAAGKKKPAKVASPATQGVKIMPEETEQLDELSKNTLKSYVDKAATRLVAGDKYKGMDRYNRVEGIKKATSKLAKEEVELEERSLTEPEMEKKEKYVKSMKKGLSGFKERYGDRAKSVMYATATRMAKED